MKKLILSSALALAVLGVVASSSTLDLAGIPTQHGPAKSTVVELAGIPTQHGTVSTFGIPTQH